MFKQNREIKILRDKKDKEIRQNLKLKLDKINTKDLYQIASKQTVMVVCHR